MLKHNRTIRVLRWVCTGVLMVLLLVWFLSGIYEVTMSRFYPSHEPQKGPPFVESFTEATSFCVMEGQWRWYASPKGETPSEWMGTNIHIRRLQTHWEFFFSQEDGPAFQRGTVLLLWIPVAAAVVPTGLLWWPVVRGLRRKRPGQCPGCGYDRSGLAGEAVCPECGKTGG